MMYRLSLLILALALCTAAFAQDGVQKGPLHPAQVDETFLQQAGAHAEFDHSDRAPTVVQDARKMGQALSVPTFTTSFNFQGQNFPLTIVGASPDKGETTTVSTQLIPISLFFDGYVDANGNNIVLDATPARESVLNSPNFRNGSYRTGVTQFADAVQRAQFNGVMRDDWHTLLRKPEQLKPVQIEVPANTSLGQVFQVKSTGKLFAVVDTSFFISHLNTIIQLQKLDVQGLPIALTNNVFLAPNAHVEACCVVGFHTAFDAGVRGERQQVQTFVWASYISAGVFGGTFEDVIALSHEISEWMNDPFITNTVPRWQYPNSTACQSSLETGDPMETIPTAGFPVTIDSTTYHPQTQALMQWFARKPASDAINAAYSFPDETLLTSAAQACPAGK